MSSFWKSVLVKIKYPKFLLLFFIILLTYIVFSWLNLEPLKQALSNFGYIATFFSGIFYAYGFTAPTATALLLVLAKQQNIFLAAIIAGLGSLLTDFVLFRFIRTSFDDEVKTLSREQFFVAISTKSPRFVKIYFMPLLAAIIIASPLPDELGVALMAIDKKISTALFSVLSFLLNTAGIFVVLLIGR